MTDNILADVLTLEKYLSTGDPLDTFVLLKGSLRSSKTLIPHDGGAVTVFNAIDETDKEFSSINDMVDNHDTIHKAIENNAFYIYGYEVSAYAARLAEEQSGDMVVGTIMKSYIIGRADHELFTKINEQATTTLIGDVGMLYVIEARLLHTLFIMSTCPVPSDLLPDPDSDIAVYLTEGDNEDYVITWLVI